MTAPAPVELEEAEAAAGATGKPRKAVVAFASSVLTRTQFHAPQALVVAGTVSGARDFSGVAVTVAGRTSPAILSDPAPSWPFTRTWAATYLLPDSALPDGITAGAAATATLQSRRTATIEQALTLDVVPPAEVDLIITADGSPVSPGAIVRSVAPRLASSWPPSHDGSGVNRYITRSDRHFSRDHHRHHARPTTPPGR